MENKPTIAAEDVEVGTVEQALEAMRDHFREAVKKGGDEGRFAKFMLDAYPGAVRAIDREVNELYDRSPKETDNGEEFMNVTDGDIYSIANIVGNYVGNVAVGTITRFWSCTCDSCQMNRRMLAGAIMKEASDVLVKALNDMQSGNKEAFFAAVVDKNKRQH